MTVETRPIYIEDRIESLPYAQPQKVAELILVEVESLNQHELKPAQRLSLLELYGKAYAFLLSAGHSVITSVSVSALEKNRRLLEWNRRIALSMGLGYKQIFGPPENSKPSRTQLQGLQRTVTYLSHALMHGYHAYLPTPPGIWKQLHALGALAQKLEPADYRFSDGVLPQHMHLSAGSSYRRILLVSLVDPFHLNHGAIWSVYQATAEWTGALAFSNAPPERKISGQFLIEPAADSQPIPLIRFKNNGYPAGGMFMDTNAVLSATHQRIRELSQYPAQARDEPQGHHPPPGLTLLKRMSRDWGLPPRRHAPRSAGEDRAQLASGLSAACHFVSGAASADLPDSEDESLDRVIGDVGEQPAIPLVAKYALEEWRITNQGPTGLCVVSAGRPTQLVRIGELISIQDKDSNWVIGVVRWQQVKPSGETVAGLQLIGTAVTVVTLYSDQPEDVEAPPQPALLLDACGDPDRCVLIAPKGVFAVGTQLQLEGPQARETVQVAQVLESTVAYDQLQCRG